VACGDNNVELCSVGSWSLSIFSGWEDIILHSKCSRIGSLVHVKGDAVDVSAQLVWRYTSIGEKRIGSRTGIIEEEGRKDAPYIMGRSRRPSRHVDPLHWLEFCKPHRMVKIKCEEQTDTCVQLRKWACSERAYCVQRGWPSL
jgi:hypothetical protein